MITSLRVLLLLAAVILSANCFAQDKSPQPAAERLQKFHKDLQTLKQRADELQQQQESQTVDGAALLHDAAVFARAAEWMLRFEEFPKPNYADQLENVLLEGLRRCELLAAGKPDWNLREETTIRGYRSGVDGSLQPYALTLPAGVNPRDGRRWPLHIVLHGRADQMNEVNFIHRMNGRKPPENAVDPEQAWIQLDVYGRGNNAYRWAGETDVFEAFADVRRRFRIDENRVTLRGFSMGGAGAWHLGLHYPHLWSSVGPGAGFVDFYAYQKQDRIRDRRPFAQHETLRIYDVDNYALNAFNVPVCTYGGENDPQLLASTTIQQACEKLDVPLTVLIGPGMGHKFDPESFRTYMDFHQQHASTGRPGYGQRKKIRFTTNTLRYSRCDWLQIQEVDRVYEPSVVDAEITGQDLLRISTENIRMLSIARDPAAYVELDGTRLPLRDAADGLLPDVWFTQENGDWKLLDYAQSRAASRNPDGNKRPGLQGPIDDAFMSAFVAVRGTGTPASAAAGKWADAQLNLFQQEYSKWMRADITVIDDTQVTEDLMQRNHVILFGDPASNSLISRVLPKAPVGWDGDHITVGANSWDASAHVLCAIFPNPLSPNRYVVLNSGHTFHEQDFRASNSWLFPRLGDVAVFALQDTQDLRKAEPIWSDVFDSNWQPR